MHLALKTIQETAPPPFAELQEEGEAQWLACDSGEVMGGFGSSTGQGPRPGTRWCPLTPTAPSDMGEKEERGIQVESGSPFSSLLACHLRKSQLL